MNATSWQMGGRFPRPPADILQYGGTVLYLGGLMSWALTVPGMRAGSLPYYLGSLCFAVSLGLAALPAYRWLSERPESVKPVVVGALIPAAALTACMPYLPPWMGLTAMACEGPLVAIATTAGLLKARSAAGVDRMGRVLAGTGALAVALAWATSYLAGKGDLAWSAGVRLLPLLVAIGALNSLPEGSAAWYSPKGRPSAGQWPAVIALVAFAGALLGASTSLGGKNPISTVAAIIGFVISWLLLDSASETICIAAGASAAVFANLSGASAAETFNGLALGLLLPLPWCLVMARLRQDAIVLLVVAGQAAVWALWRLMPIVPVGDTALIAAVVSLLALAASGGLRMDSGFSPRKGRETDPEGSGMEEFLPTPSSLAEEGLYTHGNSVAGLLGKFYGSVLTQRELQVGQLAVLGVSSRDIAAQLFLTESTIKTHLKNLYRKTDSTNRNDLYRRLVSAGNSEPSDIRDGVGAIGTYLGTASRDDLTGVHSRQSFDQVAALRMIAEQAHMRPVALLLLSIQLKSGDQRQAEKHLAVAAGIIQASLRSADLLFRYSDFQFVALLAGSDNYGAEVVGQRLVHRLHVWAASRPSPPSIVVGSASTSDGLQTLGALLAKARAHMS